MQIIVNFFQTHIFDIDDGVTTTAQNVKEKLFDIYGIPKDEIVLHIDGDLAGNELVINDNNMFIRATLKVGICGGKGGFGAMLRAKAKQQGVKRTTDFGACRDLSGRRLRHINDEIILSKWKEAKEKGEEFNVDEETPTGIDMWHLSKPSWAENIKVSGQKKFMKTKRKTNICQDWKSAREGGRKAPADAPSWWGCPRGPKCDFAHGEDELRGEAAHEAVSQRKKDKRDNESKQMEEYIAPIVQGDIENDVELRNAVREGLKKLADAANEQQEERENSNSNAKEEILNNVDVHPVNEKEKDVVVKDGSTGSNSSTCTGGTSVLSNNSVDADVNKFEELPLDDYGF